MYLSWFPCSNCTKSIIQSGISEIIVDGKDFLVKEKHWEAWKADSLISMTMLNEAGIKITVYGE